MGASCTNICQQAEAEPSYTSMAAQKSKLQSEMDMRPANPSHLQGVPGLISSQVEVFSPYKNNKNKRKGQQEEDDQQEVKRQLKIAGAIQIRPARPDQSMTSKNSVNKHITVQSSQLKELQAKIMNSSQSQSQKAEGIEKLLGLNKAAGQLENDLTAQNSALNNQNQQRKNPFANLFGLTGHQLTQEDLEKHQISFPKVDFYLTDQAHSFNIQSQVLQNFRPVLFPNQKLYRGEFLHNLVHSNTNPQNNTQNNLQNQQTLVSKISISSKEMIRHGLGEQLWSDGSYYIGQWKLNKASGRGKFIYPNQDEYEGEFLEDKAHGVGLFTSTLGCCYQGLWKNNLREGYGQEVWADGQKYEGEYSQGLKHGSGVYWWGEEEYYDGEWNKGQMHGFGKLVNEKTEVVYEGQFKNGEQDGNGVLKGSNLLYEGGFKRGKFEGQGTLTDKNPKVLEEEGLLLKGILQQQQTRQSQFSGFQGDGIMNVQKVVWKGSFKQGKRVGRFQKILVDIGGQEVQINGEFVKNKFETYDNARQVVDLI